MKKSLRDISRFSAKAACRYRLIYFAVVFIVIALLATSSVLILAFDESMPPPTDTLEFTKDGGRPEFLNRLARLGGWEPDAVIHFWAVVR